MWLHMSALAGILLPYVHAKLVLYCSRYPWRTKKKADPRFLFVRSDAETKTARSFCGWALNGTKCLEKRGAAVGLV